MGVPSKRKPARRLVAALTATVVSIALTPASSAKTPTPGPASPTKPPTRASTTSPARDVLSLTLAIGPHVRVLDSKLVTQPIDSARLTEPRLAAEEPPAGITELVVVFYDARGRKLRSFGVPGHGLVFYEGEKFGKVEYPAAFERTLQVPVPPGAAYLAFLVASTDVSKQLPFPHERSACFALVPVQRGSRTVRPRSFDVYPLSLLPGAVTFGPDQTLLLAPPLPGFASFRVSIECLGPVVLARRVKRGLSLPAMIPYCPYFNGTIEGTETLHEGAGTGLDKFNVVILGDGFQHNDIGRIRDWAVRYKNALLAEDPYKCFSDRINVYLVSTSSTDSQVTHCPDSNLRKTYFEVQGEWTDKYGVRGPHGFFGTQAYCSIQKAVGEVLDTAPNLIVVVVNCDVYGGTAEPGRRVIFLPAVTTYDGYSDIFERLAIHETSHAVAWLGEEYITCDAPDPTYPFPTYFPNVAPKSATLASATPPLWWRALLEPAEKTPSGDFRAVHNCGDPFLYHNTDNLLCSATGCGPELVAPATNDMLGLYWGAMIGTSTGAVANQCRVQCAVDPSTHCDTGTADCDYYRPMAQCRMRSYSQNMCRACKAKIKEALEALVGAATTPCP